MTPRRGSATAAIVQSNPQTALVELQPGPIGYRAVFTGAGLEALRRLLRDRRAMDPARFAHLRRELGLDVPEDAAART